MAYPTLIDDIVEIRIQGYLNTQRVINTFHYKLTEGSIDGRVYLLAMLADFEMSVYTPWRNAISQDVNGLELVAQVVRSFRYRSVVVIPANQAGAVATPAEVSGAAAVVSRFGDLAVRNNQGRIFIPGIAKADTLDSQLTAAWLMANAAALDVAMVSGIVVGGGSPSIPVIWSYRDYNNDVPITTALVDPIIRYQRRREIGKGE